MAHNWIKKTVSICLALLVWQLAADYVNFEILLASPASVAGVLWDLIPMPETWSTVAFSMARILLGFGIGAGAGILMAVLADRVPLLDTLLWPYVTVMKSVPVASFIIIVLIWLGPRELSSFIAFLMVFPVIYTNLLEGLRSTDPKLLEMAKVYQVSWGKRLVYIYAPHLRSYLTSACSVALGLSWKSGIAAELIGVADGTIGEMLYEAKIYMDTADVLAWTLLFLVVSIALEKLLMGLLHRGFDRLEAL
jgi:NitT/TauT family transport system permease protein